MEATTRLHPLLTAAAISVTVFSAVGVGALTGLLPNSIGSQKDEVVAAVPSETPAKPSEPLAQEPAEPAPKPKKTVVRVAPKKPVAPVGYDDYATPLPPAPRSIAQVETPRPVVLPGHLATVQSVREVKDPGQHTGLGPIAGGIAGAVIGDQIGKGKDTTRKVLTVLGAAGGAYAGREIEKQARATKHWEIDVRRDDGAFETVRSEVAPPYRPGERVRLVDGRLQPA